MSMSTTVEKLKEAGQCIEQLRILNNNYKFNLKVIERFKGAPYKIGQIMIRWIPSIFVILIVYLIILICRFINTYPYVDTPMFPHINMIAKPMIICSFIVAILYFPVALLWRHKSVKRDLEKVIKRSDELRGKIKDLLHEKEKIINIVPQKYRYLLAVNFFVEVLENGRADSMKEAMNLFEEQLHRWKMESKMEQVLKNQQAEGNALWAYLIADSLFR